MTWKPPKINYIPADGVTDEDLNRVEGNTLDNHDRVDKIVDGTTPAAEATNADNADKLDGKHNGQVDANTYKEKDIDTDGDGKVDNADHADNATNATNADNADNATNADNADQLDGKHWVLINSGNILVAGDFSEDIALRSGGHNYYRYSAYTGSIYVNMAGGTHHAPDDDFSRLFYAYVKKYPIGSFDVLVIKNHDTADFTFYYEVYSWE